MKLLGPVALLQMAGKFVGTNFTVYMLQFWVPMVTLYISLNFLYQLLKSSLVTYGDNIWMLAIPYGMQ